MQTNETIDVRLFLEQTGMRGFHWFTLAVLFTITVLAGFGAPALMSAALSIAAALKIPVMSLGVVLVVGNLGLLAGAFCAGPLADRYGRKPVLVGSVLALALGSLLTPLAGGANGLSIWNLVRGFGVGATVPAAATLMNEHCPAKARAALTSAVLFGFPVGVGLNLFVAKWIIGAWGWRSVFLLGGAAPVVFAILAAYWLPESALYLATKARAPDHIRRALNHISGSAPGSLGASRFTLTEGTSPTPPATFLGLILQCVVVLPLVSLAGGAAFLAIAVVPGLPRWAPVVVEWATLIVCLVGIVWKIRKARGGLWLALSRQYIAGSVALWLACMLVGLMGSGLNSWVRSGVPSSSWPEVMALTYAGGAGAILAAWLMNRVEPRLVLVSCFVLAAMALWGLATVFGEPGLAAVVSPLPGALLSTAQYALPALAAEFYPTKARATGVAWSMGLGRLGGSVWLAPFATRLGPSQLSPASGLTVLAVMSLVAAAALVVCRTTRPRSGAHMAALAALKAKSSTGSAATEDRLSSSPALQPQADHWAIRFRAIHSLVPPERQQAIIRHYMAKYGVTRDEAIRSAVEDWDRENRHRT